MKYRVYGYKKENYELAILGLEHFNREAFYVEARDENDAVSAFHFEHPGYKMDNLGPISLDEIDRLHKMRKTRK